MGYEVSTSQTTGPIAFGPVTSGGTGTVVFGSNNPTLTASLANLTKNPLMLVGIAVVLLGGLYILANGKRGIKL